MKQGNNAALLKDPMAPSMLLGTWLRFHMQALRYSQQQILRTPLASILTAVAMGISLALPTALEVLVQQVRSWSGGIAQSAQMTLFLHAGTDDIRAQQLLQQLRLWPELESAQYVSPEQALEEFRHSTGINEVVDILAENPLPAQIRVLPKLRLADHAGTAQLIRKLQKLPGVEVAELDLHWLQRLDSIAELSWRGLLILGLLFGLGVLVITANTIRIAIENQHHSIEVAKWVGATNAYIRRPFLYTGLWLGFSSGVIAWLCVYLSLAFLQPAAARLAELFGQEISLLSFGLNAAQIIPIASVLGLLGAWIGVGRYLRNLDTF